MIAVIGLLGVPGSGKGLVSKRLVERHGYRRLRFTDPVKDMLRSIGLSDEQLEGVENKSPLDFAGGCTPNHLIHSLSTDWGRGSVHSDLWANLWKRRAQAEVGPVLADDLRRPNEAAAVRAVGGIVIRITRPGAVRERETRAAQQQQLISADLEVENDRTPEHLVTQIDALIDELIRLRRVAA